MYYLFFNEILRVCQAFYDPDFDLVKSVWPDYFYSTIIVWNDQKLRNHKQCIQNFKEDSIKSDFLADRYF